MNARDQIKPKSIREAILHALSDGAITTIDDLQIKMDEKRQKVVDNAVHAANDGLIKRLRDDVTNLAAYQITQHGRYYLAKYVSGKEEEPSLPEVPVCAESQTAIITPGVKAEEAIKSAQGHIETLNGTIVQLGKEKAAFSAEIERLNRLFLAACADLAKINQHLGLDADDGGAEPIIWAINEIKASVELSQLAHQPVAPALYALQRPAKPLVRFTKLNSAETRAMAFARGGQRAQVFALTLVGTAVPGSEWRKA